MFNSFKSKLALGVASLATLASQASAALTIPTALDTGDFTSVAGIVIVALAAMWAIKKALGLVRV
jgi:hypothetical protein